MLGRAGGHRPICPAKITNHLVAMIEKTISGQDALPNISDAERIFAELLTGLAAAQPGFPLAQLKTFVDQEFAQIKHVLHGISLLGSARIASTLR